MALPGHTVSEETRQRIRATLAGRKAAPEVCSSISKGLTGHEVSEKTKQLLSVSASNMSQETRDTISHTLMGHEVSDKTRQRMSQSLTGRTMSRQFCQELSNRLLGVAKTEEHRQKIRETTLAHWNDPKWVEYWAHKCTLKPNFSELWLQEVLDKYFPNTWTYTGNFDIWFGRHNPDFFNAITKRHVIELFGEYWHDPDLFPNRLTESELIAYYKQYNINCIVVWERELCDETLIIDKVSSLTTT